MERIVVGFDGSDASVAALRWAVAEAALRDATVDAWTVAGQHERVPAAESARETWVVKDRNTLATSVESATGGSASYHWMTGCVVDELAGLSRYAGLLVLGGRSDPLGTVAQGCLRDARSTVAIVRAGQHDGCAERPVVVVGIDGTPAAQAALATGAAEARLRDATLHVVHAVHWTHGAYSLFIPSRAELLGWGQDLVALQLERAVLEVPVQTFVLAGRPVDVLVRHSREACLLVLGSQPGPVSARSIVARCAAVAPCPVLVAHD